VAATGSEPGGGHWRGLLAPARQLSLRVRLTLLYGACFLAAAAAVLAITYGLVAHNINGQSPQLYVHRARVQQVAPTLNGKRMTALAEHIFLDGSEITTSIPLPKSRSGSSTSSTHKRCRMCGGFPPVAAWLATSIEDQANLIGDRINGALRAQRRRSLEALLSWSGVALGVLAVVSILLGWLLAGKALRPIRAMSSRARKITEENLHERLSVETQGDELGELAHTFDGVLERLERAFDAQKRFVANASHELRTPVTLERTLLEVALADPDADVTQLRHTCQRVLASTEQQQRILEALLALARSQSGTGADTSVDLGELAQDAITLREQRLHEITVAADLHPAPVIGDPALLERLVANLIDNAVTHNLADDAWITIETGSVRTGSWLRVSNSGARVPEELTSEIFEPFRRVHGERTSTSTGFGLGLSIVQAIADVHDAAVTARPVDGGGLEIEARFRAIHDRTDVPLRVSA
jgi:signal transduction histidine kinase